MTTYTPGQLAYLAQQYWPADQVARAVQVALRESGGNPAATNHNTNGTTDWGLWQINDVNLGTVKQTGPELLHAVNNAIAAHTLWSRSGWQPWYSSASNATAGMAAAQAAAANPTKWNISSDAASGATTSGIFDPTNAVATAGAGVKTLPDFFMALLKTADPIAGFLGLNSIMGSVLTIVLEGMFTTAGLGLILLGVWRMSGMSTQDATKAAGTVAKVAAVGAV